MVQYLSGTLKCFKINSLKYLCRFNYLTKPFGLYQHIERNQKMLTKCLFLMLYPCWFVSFKFLTFCTLGSHVAVQYALLSYGIPVEALPIDARTGQYHNRAQKVWVQHRRSVEAAAKKQSAGHAQKQRQVIQSSIADTANRAASSNVNLKPKLKSEATGEPLDTTAILQPGPNDGK